MYTYDTNIKYIYLFGIYINLFGNRLDKINQTKSFANAILAVSPLTCSN